MVALRDDETIQRIPSSNVQAPGLSDTTQRERIPGMRVKILAPTAAAALLLSAAFAASPVAAQQNTLAADSTFIANAASAGLLQVKLGKLADKEATNSAVKEYGQRMVADYSKANEKFSAAAKQAAFPSPILTREDQQLFNRFQGLGRSSFDKTYMAEMVKQQSEELKLFQEEAEGGRVQSLKQLAASMLPDLQQRLALANQTAGSVGVQVTASAGASRRSSGQ
jgi:putative membrane protein